MSFAIALRWVTVDGHRTSYATVLNEAADLTARLARLRRQDPTLPTPPDLHALKGEPALLEWVAWARKNLTQWEDQAGQASRSALMRRLATAAPSPQRRGAVERLRAQRPTADAPPRGGAPAPPDNGAARAIEAVRTLAEDNAPDLDDAAEAEVAGLLAQLRALPQGAPPARARSIRHAAEHAIHAAVRERRHRAALELRRDSLRAQAHAVVDDEDERRALLAAIDHAEDPSALEGRLSEARAGAAAPTSTRGTVARVAAQALADIGCDVDPGDLRERGEAVADFSDRAGCSLRVRLHPSRDQVSFSLVRSGPGGDDTADQQWFCDTKEPTFAAALAAAADAARLRLRPKLRLEPGDRPLSVVSAVDRAAGEPAATAPTPMPPPRARTRHHP
ncbi:hypothetical protein J4H86_01665 [Spiractinospora alimapuensis]|uniref:hypothetical protein n=1 Tax=Spiractinospora alimapuensis TaxID=2820884 RepID=UPI001F1A3C38|nr:hypothetical protein [Spiractinospora alimapuensis]QVQ52574.1 hypothetical protein J4H86_01665 [Spiractinospora alimapuensis]